MMESISIRVLLAFSVLLICFQHAVSGQSLSTTFSNKVDNSCALFLNQTNDFIIELFVPTYSHPFTPWYLDMSRSICFTFYPQLDEAVVKQFDFQNLPGFTKYLSEDVPSWWSASGYQLGWCYSPMNVQKPPTFKIFKISGSLPVVLSRSMVANETSIFLAPWAIQKDGSSVGSGVHIDIASPSHLSL